MNAPKILLSGALAIPLVSLLSGVAQAATIAALDPFTNSQMVSRANTGTTQNNLAITSTLLGSVTRRVSLNVQTAGSGAATANIPVTPLVPGFALNTPSLGNARATIQYRGTLSGGRFNPVNFTQGGADRISVGIISSNLANAVVGVTVRDSDGTIVTLNQTLPAILTPPNPVPVDFLYSDPAFVNINFAAIQSFTLILDPVIEGNIAIRFLEIRTPPAPPVTTTASEPSSVLGLLALGLLGSLRSRKEQKS